MDFFDIDLDVDMDLEGADAGGLLNAIAVFINIGEVPFGLVFSLVILNFWIFSMMMYYLPIHPGGLINGLLLLPAFAAGIYVTKIEILPLKNKIFKASNTGDEENKIIDKRCVLKCDLEAGRLGQAEISQDGVSIVINVKTQFEEETFKKDELAFVFRKDEEKDIYYIAKLLMDKEFYT